jgi:hypothetical protein
VFIMDTRAGSVQVRHPGYDTHTYARRHARRKHAQPHALESHTTNLPLQSTSEAMYDTGDS